MPGVHKWLGWIAAGAVSGAALVGGAMAAPATWQAGEKSHARFARPAVEVLRQIHEARPELTEEQKQQWLAKVDEILAAAVKDGKMTQAVADQLRTQIAAGKPGLGVKGWHEDHPGFAGQGFSGRGFPGKGKAFAGKHPQAKNWAELTPEEQQERLNQMKSQLEEKVKAGKLTQAAADQMLQRLTERFNQQNEDK